MLFSIWSLKKKKDSPGKKTTKNSQTGMHEPKVSLLPGQGLVWWLNVDKCLQVSQNTRTCLAKKTPRAFLVFTMLFFVAQQVFHSCKDFGNLKLSRNHRQRIKKSQILIPGQTLFISHNWSQSQTHVHHECDNYLVRELIRVELLLWN